MTVFGGDPVLAADYNELIDRQNTTIFTGDSSTWGATETSVMSLTISAIAGAKYKILLHCRVSADVAADASVMRIREDNLSGNVLQFGQVYCPTTSANAWPSILYAEWTAVSTASKTFVVTGQRLIGTGTAHRIRASSQAPAYFFGDRIAN